MTEVALKDTLNAHWKNDKSGFGYRMLMKMGWSEDKGLGKNEDGAVQAVKVKKREEGVGLGMEAVRDDQVGSKAWNQTVSGFNAVLDLLKASYAPPRDSSAETDSEEDSDDKKKKKKSKKDKKQKKEKKQKKPQPIISVGIKYKKIRDAKMMAAKDVQDKHTIFGHTMPPAISSSSLAGSASLVSDASSDKEKKKKDKKDKKEKEKKNKKRKRSDSLDE